MCKGQKFAAAVVLSVVMASATMFTTPAYAFDGTISQSAICAYIEQAEAYLEANASRLPAFLVSYLRAALDRLEASAKCQS